MDYKIIIDIICIIITCIIIFTQHKQIKKSTTYTKLLRALLVCVLVVIVFDIPGLLVDGKSFWGSRTLLLIFDTLYWLPHAVFGWLWIMFTDYRIYASEKRLHKLKWIYAIPMFIETILILSNPFTGFIFTITFDNYYSISSTYLYSMIPFLFYIFLAIIMPLYGIFLEKNIEFKRKCISIFIFMFLPVCGLLLEIFAYGIMWFWPMVVLSLLMIYITLQQEYILQEKLIAVHEQEKIAKLENELIDSRIKIMLSQIQPHFLYNSLATIKALCETGSDKASDAMTNFSDFLRGNMDSLTMDKPISFEQELNHTMHYLSLEQLRYKDMIDVIYDIRTSSFRLPPLSLQPLIADAIHNGISAHKQPLIITILTHETDNAYVVTISDNSIISTEQDETKVALNNVRNRVNIMCGGTMKIDFSKANRTITITLPKGGIMYE